VEAGNRTWSLLVSGAEVGREHPGTPADELLGADHPAAGEVSRPVAKPGHGFQFEAALFFGGTGRRVDCTPLPSGE
jgi:hypothetical protein